MPFNRHVHVLADANGSPGKGPLNRAVADYLIREEERERLPLRFGNDEDVEGELVDLEAQKRSNFRERAGMYRGGTNKCFIG